MTATLSTSKTCVQAANNQSVIKSDSDAPKAGEMVNPDGSSRCVSIPALNGYEVGFLDPRDLARTAAVSRSFHALSNSNFGWRNQCVVQGLMPNEMPGGMSFQKIIRDFYPEVIGKELWCKVGNIGPVPPIPVEFLQRAYEQDPFGEEGELIKDNYQLMYTPEFIAISVDDNSGWTVDKANGRLMNPSYSEEQEEFIPNGKKRIVNVPVTMNNLRLLCSIGKFNNEFEIRIDNRASGPFRDVLKVHGDERVLGHWSFQRKVPVGDGKTDEELVALATEKNHEIVDTLDRFLFNILTIYKTKKDKEPIVDRIHNSEALTMFSRSKKRTVIFISPRTVYSVNFENTGRNGNGAAVAVSAKQSSSISTEKSE